MSLMVDETASLFCSEMCIEKSFMVRARELKEILTQEPQHNYYIWNDKSKKYPASLRGAFDFYKKRSFDEADAKGVKDKEITSVKRFPKEGHVFFQQSSDLYCVTVCQVLHGKVSVDIFSFVTDSIALVEKVLLLSGCVPLHDDTEGEIEKQLGKTLNEPTELWIQEVNGEDIYHFLRSYVHQGVSMWFIVVACETEDHAQIEIIDAFATSDPKIVAQYQVGVEKIQPSCEMSRLVH